MFDFLKYARSVLWRCFVVRARSRKTLIIGFSHFFLLAFVVGCAVSSKDETPGELDTSVNKAFSGDTQTEFELGQELYSKGEYAQAAAHWKFAAAHGSMLAYSNLGLLTYYGMGVRASPEEAVRLWHFAAERGAAEAHRHLGSAYLDGKYLTRNPNEAYARFRAAVIVAEVSTFPNDIRVAMRGRKYSEMLRGQLNQSEIDAAEILAVQYARQRAVAEETR